MNIFKYTLHKELWLWLYKHPFKNKLDWPKWDVYNDINYHCFACDYSLFSDKVSVYFNYFNCENCPLIFIKYKIYNTCLNGLYEKFNTIFIKKIC